MPRNLVPRLTKRLPYPTAPVQERESDEDQDTREEHTEEEDDHSSLPRA